MADQTAQAALHVPAQLTLFGFTPTAADVQVIARPGSSRVMRAVLWLGICWAMIPLVLFIPPHVPWVVAAFGAGIYFARKRLTERYTLTSFDGVCPKCGHMQQVRSGASLKTPFPIICESCLNELLLEVDVEAAP